VFNTATVNVTNNYTVNGFIYNQGGSVNVNGGAILTISGNSGTPPQQGGWPPGLNTGYLGGSGSTLTLTSASLSETSATATAAVYLQSNARLTINGTTNSAILGNVQLVGIASAVAFLNFGGAATTDNLNIQGALNLTYAQVNANLTYGNANPQTSTMNQISCNALNIYYAADVLTATNPNAPVAFNLTGIATSGVTGWFTEWYVPNGVTYAWVGNNLTFTHN
jgi:hypothetical protein